jgi:hypothetical protein
MRRMAALFCTTNAVWLMCDACGIASILFSLQLMALLQRGFAPAGESLFVSTKSDAKNDPGEPSKAR